MRKVIGITGTIGSGKSSVLDTLSLKIPVTDCDSINRSLLEPGQAGFEALQAAGLLPVQADGSVDKEKMKEIFSNPVYKKQVEAILHPLILEQMEAWMQSQQGLCAVEVPLLFELSLQDRFDEVWTVVCTQETALQRLEQFRNISRKDALSRLALQMPPEEKIKKSDRVIYNDGTRDDLQKQIDSLLLQSSQSLQKS